MLQTKGVTMIIYFAILIYSTAMTVANLLVSYFGPSITPINAFFLIGLTLTMRDFLHVRISQKKMLVLILVSGLITYTINPSAGIIAVASAVAFTSAAFVDWVVFVRMSGSWFRRANGSNIAGAAVDSIVFPTVAFGALIPHIIIMQFLAKVFGGALWAFLINYFLIRGQEKNRNQ
jgi:uncharacterized PurR-regulated membrane protein YhhQ (DUF165 family)